MNRPLTPALLDGILDSGTAPTPPRRSSLAKDVLWGANEIARFMNVSDDFVRTLYREKAERDPRCPIRWVGGRYFCTKTEIVAWLMPGSEERKAG
ncbi:hypothetical protein MRS76_19205 [Rhizobiaceae bacterium n13]|uniref:hypothetical protein n=1 Tax=Ferirhizobium litorale TaxID=2927786 RepID=UPI0024B2EDC1|nr:hypothetical protein [Fererhizobium litorale]MDI7864080.1 hypothetical protein [Fererhizobium litorale]